MIMNQEKLEKLKQDYSQNRFTNPFPCFGCPEDIYAFAAVFLEATAEKASSTVGLFEETIEAEEALLKSICLYLYAVASPEYEHNLPMLIDILGSCVKYDAQEQTDADRLIYYQRDGASENSPEYLLALKFYDLFKAKTEEFGANEVVKSLLKRFSPLTRFGYSHDILLYSDHDIPTLAYSLVSNLSGQAATERDFKDIVLVLASELTLLQELDAEDRSIAQITNLSRHVKLLQGRLPDINPEKLPSLLEKTHSLLKFYYEFIPEQATAVDKWA